MNKIAILISGEYRTFDVCVNTMKFLRNQSVDVYVSTWDKTVQANKYLNIHLEESVNINRIKSALGEKTAKGICVEKYDMFKNKRYNTNMIHRWKRGIDMVKESGIEYSHILIIRPDLYFSNDFPFENVFNLKDGELAFGWLSSDLTKLQDISFAGTFDTVFSVLNGLSIDDWNESNNHDWHSYWNDHTRRFTNNIKNLHYWHHAIMCRPNAIGSSFKEVEESFIIWRDTIVIKQIIEYGREFTLTAWGENVVAEIEQKQKDGWYEKYII